MFFWFVLLFVAYAAGEGIVSRYLNNADPAGKMRGYAWMMADLMLCAGAFGLAWALFSVYHYEYSDALDFWDYGEITGQGMSFVLVLLGCCINAVGGVIALVRMSIKEIREALEIKNKDVN